jgi:hypothetical protein
MTLHVHLVVLTVACFRVAVSPGPNQTAVDEDMGNVEEDVDAADPEAKSEHFMAILVECLALLNRVPDIVEVRASFKEIIQFMEFSVTWHVSIRKIKGYRVSINDPSVTQC